MPWRRRDSLSLSKTWKVARLVSAISSSPRKICLALSCDGAAVGAVADAPPVMAKDTPAAPNAKAALLAVRFVARFALAIVESPGPGCPAAILGPAGAYLSCGSGCRGDTTTWVFPPSLGASLQSPSDWNASSAMLHGKRGRAATSQPPPLDLLGEGWRGHG